MAKNFFDKEKIFRSKWLLGASLAIIIFFTANLSKEIINRHQLLTEVNNLKAEISSLDNGNVELSSLITKLQSLQFVENEARVKLNLKKPGETIIIVPENNQQSTSTQNLYSELSNGVATAKNNPKNWWDYFFKNYY